MCSVTRTFPVLGTMACNNSGANTHAGLHSTVRQILGRNVTWLWSAPASNQTSVNADYSPAWPRTMQVGVAD